MFSPESLCLLIHWKLRSMNPKDLSLQLCPEHFICRIAAGTFLHAALNTVCGISPVFIFVPVVIFFYKPCDFFFADVPYFPASVQMPSGKTPFSAYRLICFPQSQSDLRNEAGKSLCSLQKLAEFFIFRYRSKKVSRYLP